MRHEGLLDFLQNYRARLMDKKMATHHGVHSKRVAGIVLPGAQCVLADDSIMQATKCGDGTSERRFYRVLIGFRNGEVSPQGGQQQIHHGGIVKDGFRCTLKVPKVLDERRSWQVVNAWIRRRDVGRSNG